MNAEVYGSAVWVEWIRRLRDIAVFPSRDALVEQLALDRTAAQRSLKEEEVA